MRRFLALSCVQVPLAAMAAVNDMYPADYVAMPNGTLNVTAYLSAAESAGPYSGGKKLAAGELSSGFTALRISRHFSVGEDDKYTLGPVVAFSYSDLSPNAALSSRVGQGTAGMGDLRLGSVFWFHVDRPNRTYGAVSLFAILPNGDYDPGQTLNTSENRRRYVLSAGWVQPLGRDWMLDVSPEMAVYGDNTQYKSTHTLRQDNAYALTAYLRYRHSQAWQFFGGGQWNRGGASTDNGVAASGAPGNTRAYAGMVYFEPAAQLRQWQLRYARDVSSYNGLRLNNELSLRYLVTFR